MMARLTRKILRERDFFSEWIRERMELLEEQRLLQQARGKYATCWEAMDEQEPLVTVRIATYNGGEILKERALASIIRQTYSRLQILVVGDHCDEQTASAVRSIDDRRITFINLPARGMYPEYRAHRRKVAGSHPMNVGLALAEGQWIAPCDDDDEFTDDHVEVLLKNAKSQALEMIYSRALCETESGVWEEVGSEPLARGHISHGSVLYASALRFMKHSNTSWKLHGEPSDWNLWKRMNQIGVRIGFLSRITYRHHLGAYQREEMRRKELHKIEYA